VAETSIASEAVMEPTTSLQPDPLAELSTADLVKRTLDDARQLARTELELGKQEMRAELKAAIRGASELAAAFACAVLVVASLVTAIVLGTRPWVGILFAVVFAIAGGVLGGLGVKALPKKPLDTTRQRIASDVDRLKEHIA
jgi:lipopolysaccharide export LptBFGC system permease protein LptF